MFTVQVGGYTYKVHFAHYGFGTQCEINQVKGDALRHIASGQSNRNPADTPNKAVGRKIALGRALIRHDAEGNRRETFPKSSRKLFWDAYFAKLRDSRRANLVAL